MTRYAAALGLTALLAAASASSGELRGRVMTDGDPVAGVEVGAVPYESPRDAARREAAGKASPAPVASVASGPDGRFSLTLPAAGGEATPVRLEFSGPVPATRLEQVFLPADDEDLGELGLARAAALAGRVVDPRGGPVVGATVTLWAGWRSWGGVRSVSIGPQLRPLPQTTTTDSEGRFRFDAAARTDNRIRVEALAFAPVELRGQRGAPLPRPIVLAAGRSVSGTVLSQDGQTPAPDALVRFEGEPDSQWVKARSDGVFQLADLPAGAGTLVADAGAAGRGVSPLRAEQKEARIVLAPTARLAGRVVDAVSGDPVPGTRLLARLGSATEFAFAGADGRYEIGGLAGGRYALSADDRRFVPWVRDPVALTPGQTTSVDVALTRGASIEGMVTDEHGTPLPDASGRVVKGGGTGAQALRRLVARDGAFETDVTGRFVVQRLEPGPNQTLSVRHEGFELETLGGLTLRPGETLSDVTVALHRGLTLAGLVRDPDNHPIADAEVRLMRRRQLGGGSFTFVMEGPGLGPGRQTTTADGRFEVGGLSPGSYMLSVTKQGYVDLRREEVTVSADSVGQPLQLTLVPGVSISGSLVTAAGTPASGYRVLALPGGGGGEASPSGRMSEMVRSQQPSGPGGEFAIDGLVSGRTYDLRVLVYGAPTPAADSVVAPAEGLQLVVPGRGGIRGTVVDERGAPLTDFQVSYRRGPRNGVRMFFGGEDTPPGFDDDRIPVHSPDGRFVLDGVGAGEWVVQVDADGYQRGSAGVTVEEGKVTEGVEVRLARGRRIEGSVTATRSGLPVPDALVVATPSDRQSFSFRPFGEPENSARSDADGRFSISGLAPGTYSVTATHPAWSEASATVELTDAPAQVQLRLDAGAELSGVVLSDGGPVVSAQVSLKQAGQQQFMGDWQARSAATDADGRFAFDHLTPGRYTLQAGEGERRSESVEAVVTGDGNPPPVTLSLAGGARVHGSVVGLPESMLAGLDVSASTATGFRAHTQTAGDGRFELTGVPAGLLNVDVRAGSFLQSMRNERASVEVAPGQTEASIEVRFEEGFQLSGRVTRSGEPVAHARISASPEAGRNQWLNAQADASGRYVLEGLQEGEYRIEAQAPDTGGSVSKTTQIAGATSLDLEIPVAALRGRITDAETLQPLGDVRVTASKGDDWAGSTTSDSSGSFAIGSLEDGQSYSVTFQKPAYQSERRDLVASTLDEVSVVLTRGEGLQVMARDGIYGTPLGSLEVQVTDGQGRTAYWGAVSLDSEGRGEVAALQPGSYALRLWASGYAPVDMGPITVPAPPLSIALTPGGALEIRVGSQTLARSAASARLQRPDGSTYGLYGRGGEIPLRQPLIRLPNVAPGRYSLATDAGATYAVEVTEGGTARLELP